jgi:hypothetical protein
MLREFFYTNFANMKKLEKAEGEKSCVQLADTKPNKMEFITSNLPPLLCILKKTTIILNTLGTLMTSDGRNPPIHMKHRSAGVFHMPETIWNTSLLETMLLRFIISSK